MMGKVEFNDVPVIVRRRMSRIRKVEHPTERMVRKLVTGTRTPLSAAQTRLPAQT